MDSNKADPDTEAEIDIMILDYLLCIAIDTVIHTKAREKPGSGQDWNATWILESVGIIKSKLSTTQTLPQDICIKLQLLAFANLFFPHSTDTNNREKLPTPPPLERRERAPTSTEDHTAMEGPPYHTESQDQDQEQRDTGSEYTRLSPSLNPDTATELISLCTIADWRIPESRRVRILAQFAMHAAIQECQTLGDVLRLKPLNQYIPWTPGSSEQENLWTQECARCMMYLQPPPGISHQDQMKSIPASHLEGLVINFLIDLINTLEPPVLIQLEMGKLGELSRTETQQLKDRVGLR